jgi:NAD-dependent deacetylase
MFRVGPADHLLVLTGAGVSAESGLPTFRGAGGLWRSRPVEEVASPIAWRRDPRLVWEFYSMRRSVHAGKSPNPAHFALADLERKLADRFFLCTQNVDELHEQAGSARVIHMHGELFKSRCERWGDGCVRLPFNDRRTYAPPAEIPHCPCGGRIRPHIVWFGEQPFEMQAILAAVERCTLFVAVGTSGVVEPAASLVRLARRRRRVRAIYVGPEEPANRALFDDCILGKTGETLPALFHLDGQAA